MNTSWILDEIDKISRIGMSINGVTRLAFSKNDMEARAYLKRLIDNIGLQYSEDTFGNIFALYNPGLESQIIGTGSHIDTVPNGGKYDGLLGVISSLAAIKEIKEKNIPVSYPLELIVFQAEESSRFGYATMGSKIMAGKLENFAHWEQSVDNNGVTLVEAMKEAGYNFYDINKSVVPKDKYKAFVELHIDQSKTLKYENMSVAVVDGIAAPLRVKVTIHGEAAHSGSTAMRYRKDALVIASELVLAIRNLSLAYDERNAIATVGKLDIFPSVMNVVPGTAVMYIDIRGINIKTMDELFGLIRAESSKIALRYKASCEIELLSSEKPCMLNNYVTDMIENSCIELKIPYMHTISGAGHDAMNMASITESGMIFVKNDSGVSHHQNEEILKEDIEQGAVLLLQTLKNLAK